MVVPLTTVDDVVHPEVKVVVLLPVVVTPQFCTTRGNWNEADWQPARPSASSARTANVGPAERKMSTAFLPAASTSPWVLRGTKMTFPPLFSAQG